MLGEHLSQQACYLEGVEMGLGNKRKSPLSYETGQDFRPKIHKEESEILDKDLGLVALHS